MGQQNLTATCYSNQALNSSLVFIGCRQDRDRYRPLVVNSSFAGEVAIYIGFATVNWDEQPALGARGGPLIYWP